MKLVVCFPLLLALLQASAQEDSARQAQGRPDASEKSSTDSAEAPAAAANGDARQRADSPTTTETIISERPATVVVKPSNPFSGFKKCDKNGDGTISMYELTTAFHKADANGDERLSLEEFQTDIVDQPIDEGGTPDEPRIIVQQAQTQPNQGASPASGARTTPDRSGSRRRSPANRNGNQSSGEDYSDDDDDLRLDIDGPISPDVDPAADGSNDRDPNNRDRQDQDQSQNRNQGQNQGRNQGQDQNRGDAENRRNQSGASTGDTRNQNNRTNRNGGRRENPAGGGQGGARANQGSR